MNFLGDAFVENLRLRKRLTFWRVLAFAAFALLLFCGGSLFRAGFRDNVSPPFSAPYIAKVSLSGVIDQEMLENSYFSSLAENRKIKAVILHIDSGGGGATASEAFYNVVKRVSQVKPVVVVANSAMASGAYMVAMAADHIIAYNSSIIGSIGMIMQSPNLHELGKKIGVKVDVVRSGKLKAFPSMMEEFTEEARSAFQYSVTLANESFLSMVKEKRNITDPAIISQIATGKIFLGKEALDFALIDEIGDETSAVEWLKERGITGKVRDLGSFSKKNFNMDKLSLPSSFANLAAIFDSLYSLKLVALFPASFS